MPDHLFGTVHHSLGIGISLEICCTISNIIRGKGEQAGVFCQVEFGQAFLAKISRCSVVADALVLQEQANLFTDALIVSRNEKQLDLVKEAVACQGDAHGLPGTVIGLGESFREGLAVIGEVLHDKLDCGAGHLGQRFSRLGVWHQPDDLPHPEVNQPDGGQHRMILGWV